MRKRVLALLVLAAALLGSPGMGLAACTTTTFWTNDGRIMWCTTCCIGTYCSTTCV